MDEANLTVWKNSSVEINNTNSSEYFDQPPLYSPPVRIVFITLPIKILLYKCITEEKMKMCVMSILEKYLNN